jgi:hypothetical protein
LGYLASFGIVWYCLALLDLVRYCPEVVFLLPICCVMLYKYGRVLLIHV